MGVASRVEMLCIRYGDGELDDLPEAASGALARILVVVRAGEAGEALVADLDLIEAALVGELDGVTVPVRGFRPVKGMEGHPVVYVGNCPNRACSRRVVRTSGVGEPVECAITEQPLEFVRLPT